MAAEHARKIWDVSDASRASDFGIKPAGILALDVARLEAGFILLEVDYIGAEKALIASQRYSPFEIGLGWTVDLQKGPFRRRQSAAGNANRKAARRGKSSAWKSACSTTNIFTSKPVWRRNIPLVAWRGGVPVYKDDRQVGHATTGAWSPALKKYIALATMEKECVPAGHASSISK